MSSRGLLVGTFPPRRCGIAAYNDQLARAGGWIPFPASPESPVSLHLPSFLRAIAGAAAVRISFDPYAIACGSFQALLAYPVLLVVGRRRFEIVVHEPWPLRPYRLGLANLLYRAFCRGATWLVHVASQEETLRGRFGHGVRTRHVEHGGHFRRAYAGDRASARRELGLDGAEIWLCIGFVAAAKGFSRFVQAFLERSRPGARVVVVGTVRTPEAVDLAEADRLAEVCASSGSRAEFRDGFVDDEGFDRWIAAADVVVLPYLGISTSGVVERARLFGKVVLARDLPGLRDVLEGDPRGVLYRDEQLAEAIERAGSLATESGA